MKNIRNFQEPLVVVDTKGMPNDEWLEYRRKGIGGSDAGIIMNTSPWATPLGLYHDKIGTTPLIKEDEGKNFIFAYGHFMEPFVAEYFYDNFNEKYKTWLEEKIGKKIDHIKVYRDTNLYRHPKYEFMQLNLDFRCDIITSEGGFLRGVFECKTTSQFNADKWQGEDYPINYGWQCRHAMAVIDADFSVLACVAGNTEGFYFVKFIKRDKPREQLLISEEKKFWDKVIKREPPTTKEMDVSDGAALIEDLKKYVNATTESRKELYDTEDNSQPFKEYFKLKDEMKVLKKKLDVEEGKIREKLGESQSAILEQDDYIYSVSSQRTSRTSIDIPRLRKERPDIADAYNKTSASNTVRINRRVNKKK